MKRNHTPNVEICKCNACEHIASAPSGRRHRGCKKMGKWNGVGEYGKVTRLRDYRPTQS